MRKIILLLSTVIIILFPIVLFSQSFISKGVKFAYTNSTISHEKIDEFTGKRSGFNIALFFELSKNKVLSFVSHIEYSQKGFVEGQNETNEAGELIQFVEANTRLDYLTIPVFLKLKFSGIKYGSYFIPLNFNFKNTGIVK